MSELGAKWISCDHTFKSVCNIGYVRENDRQWINQYNSIFCVLNEKGEIINWQFTATESFDEIKEMFLDVAKNKKTEGIQIVCIDNCCKWRHLLQAIFPGASVKQDLFHAVQRFCKTLKKKDPLHRELASDYGKIFRHPEDQGDTRKMETPAKNILTTNMDNFCKKWENREYNGNRVLTTEQLNAIAKIREHITKGCLSNIPVHCSTSVNERLHKDMKKILCKNRLGTRLAYAKFSRYFFKHNGQRGKKDLVQSLNASFKR